jgi:hypothetical protein
MYYICYDLLRYPLEQLSLTTASTSPPPITLSPRTRAKATPVPVHAHAPALSPTPSPKLAPSSARPPLPDDTLNPPELVAKGASLTTVFTSVSRASKESPPPSSVPTIATARMVKSPSYMPPTSSSSPPSNSASPSSTRMIRSPSYAPSSNSSPSSPAISSQLESPPSPLAFPRTAPSTSNPASRRLSANNYNQSKVVIGSGTDPTKRGPNYELLRETVRQATVKLEGLVARAREVVETCNDVPTALRIVGSLRVVQEVIIIFNARYK